MSAFRSTRLMHDTMAFDRKTVRSMDRDGRLHIAVSNMSKEGVDPYYGREIPKFNSLGLDPDRVYYLYRPAEELAAGAASFNNVPILSKHIPVTAEAPQQELIIGSTGTTRMFLALRTAAVGSIESVMTRLFITELVTRSIAGPESTPWVM